MATSEPTDQDEIIKCSICFEIFNNPKYLPCLHTFCETCLGTYITSCLKNTDDNGGSLKVFNCPICRAETKCPENVNNPKELAGNFPKNHLIITLIDQNKLRSKERHCDPCFFSESNVTAISWCLDCNEALCQQCDAHHKALKITRNHHIVPLTDIENSSKLMTSLDFCEKHTGEKVKFYCVDHDIPCCSTCVTVNHRKCDNVKTLEEVAQENRGKSDISSLCQSFKEIKSYIDSIVTERAKNFQELHEDKSSILSSVAQLRQDINKHFDDLEYQITQHVQKVHEAYSNKVKEEIEDFENSKKIIENCQVVTDACIKHASDIHVFLEMKQLKKRLKEQIEYLKARMKTTKHVSLDFKIGDKVSSLKDDVESIGTILTKTKAIQHNFPLGGVMFQSLGSLKDCAVKERLTFKVPGDPTGGIYLPDGNLLLTDRTNSKLIVTDTSGNILRTISLKGKPWDIALNNKSEIAVSISDKQIIQFVKITDMCIKKHIEVDGLDLGITYNGCHLVVCCKNSLKMVDTNGSLVSKFQVKPSPWYVYSTAEDNILVSQFNNSISCLKMNGEQLFTYSSHDLNRSLGVSCDNDGNIYVCGWSSNNIHQLTCGGKLVKIILDHNDGIKSPRAIKFDPNSNQFFVTCYPDTVKIFEFIDPNTDQT